MDYSNLNLDTFLRPINSPVFKADFNTSYGFDYGTERSSVDNSVIQDQAITNAKIANLTADKITSGTISSGIVYAGSVSASQVSAGTLVSGVVYAGTISANQLTAGTIDSLVINGGTVTGALIQTASTGARVNMSANNSVIDFYDGGNDLVARLDENATSFSITSLDTRNLLLSANNSAGTITISAAQMNMNNTDIVNVDTLSFNSGEAMTSEGTAVNIASGKSLVFLGTQGGVNCGNINCNSINMNDNILSGIKNLSFNDNSNSPSNREVLMDDDGSNQRMRVKFANSGTQWQFDLTSTCEPVTKDKSDVKYKEKYDLMEELDDDRFTYRWADDESVQEEYRGMPKSHFPSMGNDGTEWKQHMDASWKRSWLPMKTFPDRMETMGQYPYAPPESPLIGDTESKANIYQLMAHGYNKSQDRIDELLTLVSELTDRVLKLESEKILKDEIK